MRKFVCPRRFEVSWDGAVRGVGSSIVGVPQGSPLSPVLFLVWMALILVKIERRIREELLGVHVEFPFYVEDLHCRLYDERTTCRCMMEVERREVMGDLVNWVSVVLKEVAAERGLPLGEDKEERLILRGRGGRRGRRGVCEKMTWLRVIMDEALDLGPHWETRIGKARSLLVRWMGWVRANGG